jgi:hypothetical protein
MNTKYRRLPARFAREVRFQVQPALAAPFRAAQEARFERLKHRLLLNSLNKVPQDRENARLRRAANEAAALAWVTPYPLLVYPVLFEEKARAAMDGRAVPDLEDVNAMAVPVLSHRVVVNFQAEAEGMSPERLVTVPERP